MKVRTASAVAVGAAALLALSGCGSDLGTDIHPGHAAVVGDHEISFDAVDDGAEAYCESMLTVPQRGWEARSMASVRAEYLDVLVDDQLAHLYVDDSGIDVSETVKTNMAAIKAQIADPRVGVAKEAQGALRDFFTHVVYAQSVHYTVGSELAGDSAAQMTDEELLAKGEQALRDWADEAGVDISVDPRFDLAGDGSNQVSVAVSDLAKVPLDTEATQEDTKAYIASLPDSQTCA